MNFCSNCGNKLNDENKCTNCDSSVESNNDEKNNKRKNITSKIFAWISFILAIMPILVIFGTIIVAKFSSDPSGLGALPILYIYFALVPVAFGSLFSGIISIIIKKNILSSISFLLNLLPLIYSVFYLYMLFS